MAIRTTCPKCEHPYRLREHYAGATVRCRECEKTFTVDESDSDVNSDTSLRRASPGLVVGLMAGTVALILAGCIGVPAGLLFLVKLSSTKPQPQAKSPAPAAKPQPEHLPAEAPVKSEAPAKPAEKGAEKTAADWAKDLEDADPKTRETALKTLGKLKDPTSIPSVARRLTDPKDRKFASEALKAFGSPAEEEVVKYLQQPEKEVRVEVCRILHKIGTKASVPALEETAKAKERDVANEARNAIKEINKRG
jgi:hypothetical protein